MNMRKITSMTMLLSFLFCLLSSIVLYIVPHGRVAYWAEWRFWGMTKTQWADLHITLGFLFLLAGFLHVFYNWKVITAYMKNKARQVKVFTPSFNVALMLCLAIGLTTFYKIPPVYSIISFSESLKDAAAEKYGEPPYGHAELSSLKTFSKKMDIELAGAIRMLNNKGLTFSGQQQTIAEIASANHMTPKEVYEIIQPAKNKSAEGNSFPSEPFPGFGRKTLADICTEYILHVPNIVSGLAKESIQAEPSQTIKEIAAGGDMDPHAFFEILHKVVTD